jgi:hypothetical protein
MLLTNRNNNVVYLHKIIHEFNGMYQMNINEALSADLVYHLNQAWGNIFKSAGQIPKVMKDSGPTQGDLGAKPTKLAHRRREIFGKRGVAKRFYAF